jgi:hypothetical protein
VLEMMSQNVPAFRTGIQRLAPTIRQNPAFSSIPEGEEDDEDITDNAGVASSSASGNLGPAHPPQAPPDSESGINDFPTFAKGQFVTNFGQGTLGRVPQHSTATTSGSVSHLECPRHFGAGQAAGPHNLGDNIGCGCCANTCHICLAEPPTTSIQSEEPETVATAAPAGEPSPAGTNVEDPLQASQTSVSPNSFECEFNSLNESYGDDQRVSTTSVTGTFSGYTAHCAFDFDALDAMEAAGAEQNAPPPEEERNIPEPPPGGPPIGPWTDAGVDAVPQATMAQIGTLVEQGDDDSDDSDVSPCPSL